MSMHAQCYRDAEKLITQFAPKGFSPCLDLDTDEENIADILWAVLHEVDMMEEGNVVVNIRARSRIIKAVVEFFEKWGPMAGGERGLYERWLVAHK